MNKEQQKFLKQIYENSIDKNSMYELLKAYDNLIKQNKIQRSSTYALQVYASLIQQQTNASSDILDPQQCFSFSKTKPNVHVSNIKPERLFKNIIQFKSDRPGKTIPTNINQISQFRLQQTKSRTLKSQSPTISINKTSESSPYINQLLKYRYTKSAKQFLAKLKNCKKDIKILLNKKTSIYFYEFNLLKKIFKGFQINQIIEKQKYQDIEKIIQIRNQNLIEEYFIAWKQLMEMSEVQKDKINLIEYNEEMLAKIVFLKRFRNQTKKHLKDNLQEKQRILKCYLAIKSIEQYHNNKKQLKNNMKTFKKCYLYLKKQTFLSNFRKYHLRQQQKIQKQSKKCLLFVCRTFFSKMKEYHNFQQVYWKNKSKIIFLYMLLNTIKSNFIRKGFNYQWMDQFNQNFNENPASQFLNNFIKRKLFNTLKKQCKQVNDKIKTIRNMRGKSFIYKLILNLKIKIKQETINQKIYLLKDEINRPKIVNVLAHLQYRNLFEQKYQDLVYSLVCNRVHRTIQTLSIYRISKQYYVHNLQQFKQRKYQRDLGLYFRTFKAYILKDKQNKIIANKYRKFKQAELLIQIFEAFRRYSFQQKLFNKKMQYTKKNLYNNHGTIFIKKLKLIHRITRKYKNQSLISKIQKLRINRCKRLLNKIFKAYQLHIMHIKINNNILYQYKLQQKWKIFKVMKVYTNSKHKQIKQIQQIRNKCQILKKRKYFNNWIENLTKILLWYQQNKTIQYKLKKIGFQKLIKFQKKDIQLFEDSQYMYN